MIVLFDNWLLIHLNGMRIGLFLIGLMLSLSGLSQVNLEKETRSFYESLDFESCDKGKLVSFAKFR